MAMTEAYLDEAQETGSEGTRAYANRETGCDLYGPEMRFRAEYYPLGFPVQIATNSEAVLTAARASWGRWEQRFEIEPIRLQIGVREGGVTCPDRFIVRAYEHLLVGTADAENFFVADLMRDTSFMWVTEPVVAQPHYLRHHFLESTALSHIANRHAAPVHAACVAREGHGVLLCGDSGAGKSTLAFACARAGWTYVSDDASYLAHGREDRQVLGICHSVRLRPEAARFFSEVRGRPLTSRMTGKPSIEIPTAELPAFQIASECEANYVVFLNRSAGGEQELVSYPREASRRYMHRHLNEWAPLRREQLVTVERMMSAHVFELRYHDLDWAIDRLERMVRENG
ncbi:MAG TPA: aldolase [Acidobacteriaceae bacterium]